MLTAMILRPTVVRNTRRTPNGPDRLGHLRLNVFVHAVPAEDVATASDGSRKIHNIRIHADHTIE